MIDLNARPMNEKEGSICPLCQENLSSMKDYQRHVGRHQEQLALFALPSLPTDDDAQIDENASGPHTYASLEDLNVPYGQTKEETPLEPLVATKPVSGPMKELEDLSPPSKTKKGARKDSRKLSEDIINHVLLKLDAIDTAGIPEFTIKQLRSFLHTRHLETSNRIMSDSVVYHYLAIGKLGRGEPIKLFMKDAVIDFEERLYARDDTWPETKEKLIKQGITRNGQVPCLEYKGHAMTGHVPILRYLSRDLGRYEGQSNEDKYLTDLVSDIYVDWRAQWVRNLKEGPRAEYKDTAAPQYYDLIGKYYTDREGPFLLGDEISYTDFLVYVSIDNDTRTKTIPENLPESLIKFKAAFEARPKLVEYIKQG
ncbi:hypothetical protein FAUST_975 [Fusarium austroamericanum]|uniref:GST N-terminal domain-containing protein n=1 Tax=Fusarium austroamericanum TaxID=282268 RepID=A0AAN6HK23_FUSAU|nr:hypothetical protein FAUST_975 [Fusarium austroamericanum]